MKLLPAFLSIHVVSDLKLSESLIRLIAESLFLILSPSHEVRWGGSSAVHPHPPVHNKRQGRPKFIGGRTQFSPGRVRIPARIYSSGRRRIVEELRVYVYCRGLRRQT